MVSNYCTECAINWSPAEAPEGLCPRCGSGTVCREERRELHAEFERYYAEREAKRTAGSDYTSEAA